MEQGQRTFDKKNSIFSSPLSSKNILSVDDTQTVSQ